MDTKRSQTPRFARPFGQPSCLPPPANSPKEEKAFPTDDTLVLPEGDADASLVVDKVPQEQPAPVSAEKVTIPDARNNRRNRDTPLVRSLPFLLREAMTNLRRHRFMTIAAITTIAVALALLGAFLVTFYEIDTATRRAVSDFEVRIFCRTNLPKKGVEKLGPKIRALPGVSTVTFRSREQVWDEQKKNYSIDISGIPNQMNDTYIVKLSDPERVGEIAKTVRGWSEVQEAAVPEDELNGVRRVAGFLRNVGGISSVVLLFGSLVVVSNTIRASVAARHREIKIMQIVGASPSFIRTPLLLEGLIHGAVGGILACLCLYLVGHYVDGLIRTTVPMLLPYGGPIDLRSFSLALIGAGALIGTGGSLLSMHRYLRIH